MAADRDIRDSTINVGLDEEGVGRLLDEKLARIAREKGVPVAPLQAVLAKLGEVGVPDQEIPARLEAAADQLIELRAQLARLNNERPELAAVRAQALALIDEGDLDRARAVLNGGRAAARALREEASRSEAELLADEARIDHLQLAYRAAAEKYREAAALVAPFDREGEWRFLMRQASELDDHGREFGDNGALADAIAVYTAALQLCPRAASPLDWAATQNNLGNALCDAWRARERHGAAGGGGRRLSRGAGGTDPRARAARLGDDAEQPRQRAPSAGRARERHGAAGGGGRRLSRGAGGTDPRARAARLGRRRRTTSATRSRRSASARAARRGWRRRSPPIARRWRNGPASACRSTGP